MLQVSFPPSQVGDIYQNFICKGEQASGVVQNIVDWSVPGFLEVCLMSEEHFSVRPSHSLYSVHLYHSDFQACKSRSACTNGTEGGRISVRANHLSEIISLKCAPSVNDGS